MKKLLLALTVLMAATPAFAGNFDAREVARQNNCAPKKIEVFQNTLGSTGKTIYRVTCTLPKMTGQDAKGSPDAVLVSCDQMLCTLLRPIMNEKK